MQKTKIIAILIVAILLGTGGYVLLADDGSDPDTGDEYPSSVTITQNDGKNVTVATPLEKVCLVNVNAAEFMQVLGVADRVVGVSESIATDEEFGYIYDNVTTIGTYSTPNGEQILATGATVVIGQCTSMAIKDTTVLENMGITVILLDCYGLNQQTSDLRQLSSLFGFEAQEKAEQYIAIFEDVISSVAQANADFGPDVTCYMELSNGKAYTSKAELTTLIDLAGGYNIVNDLVSDPTSSTQLLSNEVIIAYDDGNGPDFILLRKGGITDNASAESEYQTLVSRQGWGDLDATLNDNIYIITLSGMMSGPRIYIGLVYLTETFHPGVLDIDSEQLLEQYNLLFGYDITSFMEYRHLSS
ncbi:MAG: ABC transporter substrate-binding protein [Methanomassiliicoccales archaeon]